MTTEATIYPAARNAHDTVISSDSTETDDVFVARQPIVDRRGRLVAYELICRHAADATAVIDTAFLCSAAVVARTLGSIGLDSLIGKADAYLHCPEDFLMADVLEVLPARRFVLEVPAMTILTEPLLQRCKALRDMGFRLALEGVHQVTADVDTLLPYIDIVKIASPQVSDADFPRLVAYFKQRGKQVVAGKIDGRREHANAIEAQCDFVQGYYFSKPQLIVRKKTMPTAALVLRVLQLLLEDAEHATIAKALGETPVLVAQLLRLANSGSQMQGHGVKVSSIRQALSIAGTGRLIQWCCLVLYTNPDGLPREQDPLVALAERRANLMSKISRKVRVADQRYEQTAYLTGMLSLLHVVHGTDARTFLDELPLEPVIKNAIAYREGDLGGLLSTAEHFERGELRMALARLDAMLDHAAFGAGFLRSLMPTSTVASDRNTR